MAPVIPYLFVVSFIANGLPGFFLDALSLVPSLLKFLGRLLDRVAMRYSAVIKEAWRASMVDLGEVKTREGVLNFLVPWKPLKSENNDLLDQQ